MKIWIIIIAAINYFCILTPADTRSNVNGEAFGQDWDIREDVKSSYTTSSFPGILQGQSQTVLFKPLSGLFNQSKLIPQKMCPITIELELVHDATEPVVSYFAGPIFNSSNTTAHWAIQNVQANVICVYLTTTLKTVSSSIF